MSLILSMTNGILPPRIGSGVNIVFSVGYVRFDIRGLRALCAFYPRLCSFRRYVAVWRPPGAMLGGGDPWAALPAVADPWL